MSLLTLALAAGYAGSTFSVLAFFMRAPIRPRQLSIVSNVLLILFALQYHIWGTLVSGAILVPLNLWRLRELYNTRRAVRIALATTELSWDWLRPFTTRRHFAQNAIVFRRGEIADEVFFILDGTVLLEELASSSPPALFSARSRCSRRNGGACRPRERPPMRRCLPSVRSKSPNSTKKIRSSASV